VFFRITVSTLFYSILYVRLTHIIKDTVTVTVITLLFAGHGVGIVTKRQQYVAIVQLTYLDTAVH